LEMKNPNEVCSYHVKISKLLMYMYYFPILFVCNSKIDSSIFQEKVYIFTGYFPHHVHTYQRFWSGKCWVSLHLLL
jgi:hypothetical protein